LPSLDEEALFRQFRLDEPWDSPANIRLLDQMPRVYNSPYRSPKGDTTTTYYQVFTGRGTALGGANRPRIFFAPGQAVGPVAVFDPPVRLADLPDRANTFLVVEAADPVPWTKPADIEYRPTSSERDIRELIRRIEPSRFGFDAVMADGSVRRFPNPKSIPPEELDSLITGERSRKSAP
jgi:hypothetical protein